MRVARLRALTQESPKQGTIYPNDVEMRVARLRALTQVSAVCWSMSGISVEMRVARLRALTPHFNVAIHMLLGSGNESCPS